MKTARVATFVATGGRFSQRTDPPHSTIFRVSCLSSDLVELSDESSYVRPPAQSARNVSRACPNIPLRAPALKTRGPEFLAKIFHLNCGRRHRFWVENEQI